MNLKTIKAVAFDFGGTLDIPGTHWFDFFWSQFEGQLDHNHFIAREQYWNAYVYGERQMEKHGIPRDSSFHDTIFKKLSYQFEYISEEGLFNSDDKSLQVFIGLFTNGMSQIDDNLKVASGLIQKLSEIYDVSIVSNYYGNLEKILKDVAIYPYLDRLLDSTIVGIRKPDPAIWKMALDQSGVKPEEFLIIGDSMKNDILPAQFLGCPTVLINKTLPSGDYKGDRVESLNMLAAFFNL